MTKKIQSGSPSQGQFLVYSTEDGRIKVEVRLEDETVWLTQQHMAELFQTTQQNISLHLQNIYDEGELQRSATHKDSLSVRQEGARAVQRRLDLYKLDAIISVGYRIKSAVATRFRIWATRQLREFVVKGFVLDDERLKNPDQPFDYFDELLRRRIDIAHYAHRPLRGNLLGTLGSPVCWVLNGRCVIPPPFPSAASPVPAG